MYIYLKASEHNISLTNFVGWEERGDPKVIYIFTYFAYFSSVATLKDLHSKLQKMH